MSFHLRVIILTASSVCQRAIPAVRPPTAGCRAITLQLPRTTSVPNSLFYENFVLALLASRACVGWHWFKYQDNDPDDPHAEASNKDSNKGIVDRFYKPYGPLLARMRDLNRKTYSISDAIDSADVQAITRDRQ
jgi:hypothetical protein